MNESNFAQEKNTEQMEGTPVAGVIDEAQKQTETPNLTEQDSQDEVENQINRFISYVVGEWSKTDFTKRIEIGIAGLGLLVLIAYTIFSALQWMQIKYTNQLTARALDGNDKALNLTLGKMQAQIDTANAQYGQLILQTGQTSRLANATETANGNVIASDRPWMGGYIGVTNFELGKKPTITVVFTNSGKRPARLDLTAVKEESRQVFPKNSDADYIFDTTPSASVIVPGQPSLTSQTLGEVVQPDLDLLNSGAFTYFIFAKVEYRDLRTNEHHWTHVCIRYMPAMKSATDNGFRNCTEYNDAE